MTPFSFNKDAQQLVGHKIAGLTLTRWLDSNAASAWYEAVEDAGDKRLIYIYADAQLRNKHRSRVHGFRTIIDTRVDLAGTPLDVFAIVGDHRVMMVRKVKEHLTADATKPKDVAGFELQDVLGHGCKGVTFRARRIEGTGTEYALKLTVAEDYKGSSYLPEVARMVELAKLDRDHFPHIHACGEHVEEVDGRQHKLVYFVEDLIPGMTLGKCIDQSPGSLSVGFLERFIREMLGALRVMQQLGLMHDDLHSGNIILHESLAGLRPVIIDFGSTKPRGNTKKQRDDIRNLASHIAQLANLVSNQGQARSTYEDGVIAGCEGLLATMSDDDPLRRPDDATELLEHFERNFPRGSFQQKLLHPFDFGNAEEVMDNHLLQELAAKRFPWREKLDSSANLLVIGPRGCGKTTVFRSMSFNCLADAGQIQDALRRPYLGLYISCNKDFRQRFSALDREVLARRGDDIRHYFNLLVLREFVSALVSCEKNQQLGQADIDHFRRFVLDKCFSASPENAAVFASLADIEGAVTRAIHAARMAIWNDQSCNPRTDQSMIADLATLAGERITPFLGKTLYLLVDDYTERKVPKEAQQALNHVLFVPNAIFKTKMSSEVFGVAPDQTFGSFLDQDRDYKELNLGTLFYIHLPSTDQKDFLREIVDTRLSLCDYQGKVAEVIGDTEHTERTLARALRAEADARRLAKEEKKPGVPSEVMEEDVDAKLVRDSKKAYYHGWDTVCDLCTGDVSSVLELLNRMYSQCDITKATKTRIEARHQHSVIQRYSLQYIAKIKGIPGFGEKLFELVDAFGSMAARLLREYPLMEREGRRAMDPYQLIRIELDEGFVRSAELGSDPEVQEGMSKHSAELTPAILWQRLQRYCIFIDADETRSRRNTLAGKVILRRMFCPAFGLGLVNSESFTLDKRKWEEFCADPKGTADRYAHDVVVTARRRRGLGVDEELPLFKGQEART